MEVEEELMVLESLLVGGGGGVHGRDGRDQAEVRLLARVDFSVSDSIFLKFFLFPLPFPFSAV